MAYKKPKFREDRYEFLVNAKRRNQPTPSEKIFAKRLRESGIKYRQQVIAGFYILDFVLDDRGIIIEIDGGYHEDRKDEDTQRDLFFEHYGWKTIRIRNEFVDKWVLDFPKQDKKWVYIFKINSQLYDKKERKVRPKKRRKPRKRNKAVTGFKMSGVASERLEFFKKNVKLIKKEKQTNENNS